MITKILAMEFAAEFPKRKVWFIFSPSIFFLIFDENKNKVIGGEFEYLNTLN